MDLKLDVASLQSRTVEQPDVVMAAVEETRKPEIKLATSVREQRASRQEAAREDALPTEAPASAKGRAGKVSVQTWISKEKRRRFKMLSIRTDVSIEEYLAKAIDEILARHDA